MNVADGMNYAPQGKPQPVVKPGEFIFSAAHIDHGHIYGMCNGLTEAGGTLKYVYDPDPKKVKNFIKAYPAAIPAQSLEQVLEDKETRLVASSNVTSQRGPLGVKVMQAGKDYFSDKAPFTTLDQLNAAKDTVAKTGQKYMVYYSERLHVEGAILAGYMIDQGEIGKVISVTGFGPHRLGAAGRPRWFFEREKYGGILCDIGSHQIEQYLHFAGEEDATVQLARIGNYAARHVVNNHIKLYIFNIKSLVHFLGHAVDNFYIHTYDFAVVIKFKRRKKSISFYNVVVSFDIAHQEKGTNPHCNNH